MRQKYTEDDVKKAVGENVSIAGVLRQLGLKPIGGNYRTVNHLIKKLQLDTSHFTGQGWNIGLKFRPKEGASDESIFVKDSHYSCSWRLRERYKRISGICKCERCGLTSWQGEHLSLEIHHINRNNSDNRLENLQLLCPNCHALTKNYRGRARNSS